MADEEMIEGAQPEQTPAETPAAPADSFEAFLDGIDGQDEAPVENPENVIFIRSTQGGSQTIQATEPMTLEAIIAAAGLSSGAGVEYYVNGLPRTREFTVAPGGTVTIVTSVKGG